MPPYLQFLLFLENHVLADHRRRDDETEHHEKRHLCLDHYYEIVVVVRRVRKVFQPYVDHACCPSSKFVEHLHYAQVDRPLNSEETFVIVAYRSTHKTDNQRPILWLNPTSAHEAGAAAELAATSKEKIKYPSSSYFISKTNS